MKYKWAEMTDEQKMQAVREELSLPTHNGTTKDDLVEALKFLNIRGKVLKGALELACTDLYYHFLSITCDWCPLEGRCESEPSGECPELISKAYSKRVRIAGGLAGETNGEIPLP